MKKSILLLVLVAVLVCSCAMHRNREHVREGTLIYRLHSEAFLKEWGPADKITSTASDEFINFPSSAQNVSFIKRNVPLQVWIYEKKGVALVFNKYRLVGWKTDKSPAELKALSKKLE